MRQGMAVCFVAGFLAAGAAEANCSALLQPFFDHVKLSVCNHVRVKVVSHQGNGLTGYSDGTARYTHATGNINTVSTYNNTPLSVSYSDRNNNTCFSGAQPFAANSTDKANIEISPLGVVTIRSVTWGNSFSLSNVTCGNNVLMGWGGQIGNYGSPAYYILSFSKGADLC